LRIKIRLKAIENSIKISIIYITKSVVEQLVQQKHKIRIRSKITKRIFKGVIVI